MRLVGFEPTLPRPSNVCLLPLGYKRKLLLKLNPSNGCQNEDSDNQCQSNENLCREKDKETNFGRKDSK